MNDIFSILGEQLRSWRSRRNLTQPALAKRLGRDRSRISELERDLIGERWGRDRLTLFAEMCDALNIVPVLVPRGQATEIRAMFANPTQATLHEPIKSTFDELFIDLDDGDEGDN